MKPTFKCEKNKKKNENEQEDGNHEREKHLITNIKQDGTTKGGVRKIRCDVGRYVNDDTECVLCPIHVSECLHQRYIIETTDE